MKACGSKRKRGLLGWRAGHVEGREKRSKERLLEKSIEGNSNLVSMVGEPETNEMPSQLIPLNTKRIINQ
nr:hypothetical protein CFP56_15145 [Quercus suber]